MGSATWFLFVGSLMLAVGLTAPFMRRLPVPTAVIYLAVGIVVGPTGLNLFHFNPLRQAAVLELLAEGAVLLALFGAGLKMPVPVRWSRWRTPILLAFLSMAITVGWWPPSRTPCSGFRWASACSWARSSPRPIPCSPATCRCATPATATRCASR
jgi:Kef-type K+ transport system membrane component KefB